jgi:hypothetical protein
MYYLINKVKVTVLFHIHHICPLFDVNWSCGHKNAVNAICPVSPLPSRDPCKQAGLDSDQAYDVLTLI